MFSLNTDKTKRILVIDDDESLQRMVRIRLERHDKHEVVQATNGASGLAKLKQMIPDLIILDWMLPDITGIEILHFLQNEEQTKSIPVLMLSGRDLVGDVDDALALGASDYLTKPLQLNKLSERVSRLL